MKNLISLFIMALFIQATVSSQPCLPGGIIFNTQAEIDSFQANHPNCTEIQGDVEINDNSNGDITNLNGLSVLTDIGGYLKVKFTGGLTNLNGLDNLSSIGGTFLVGSNNSLISLTGLNSLKTIGGVLDIGLNPALISFTGLNYLDSIGGDVLIGSNNSLTSFTGLNSITSIGGFLNIGLNPVLASLNGLDKLTYIGGKLEIGMSPALINLSGLDNLLSINGDIVLGGNNALVDLQALNKVTSIGGEITIGNNNALTSLSGLDNINASSISSLNIGNNSSLATCEVQSVCDYLVSPGGTIQIGNNAPGCNSQTEVEAACAAVSNAEINIKDQINIFPNPANTILNISNISETSIREIIINDLSGRKVLYSNLRNEVVDVSGLLPGMYVVEVVSDDWVVREKLLVR